MTEHAAERDLEQAMMDRLQQTLLEFGHGYAFVGRQVRFDVDGDQIVVDMLLFNTFQQLRCNRAEGGQAGLKVCALVAGMVVGGDSVADRTVLPHGGMGLVFPGVRAPTTLGTFLRAFKLGHVRQLDAVVALFLSGLTERAGLIDTAATLTYLHVDDTIGRTYGYAKQGSGYGTPA